MKSGSCRFVMLQSATQRGQFVYLVKYVIDFFLFVTLPSEDGVLDLLLGE